MDFNKEFKIKDEIQHQINLGFNKNEIKDNLISKGYTLEEFETILSNIKMVNTQPKQTTSTKNILFGIFFLIVVLVRVGRFINTGDGFLGLGVITGIAMMFYFFSKND